MVSDSTWPGHSGNVKGMILERLKEADEKNGEKLSIDFQGTPHHLYVISMPVEVLFFNPETHRVGAQKSSNPERLKILEEKPWSPQAQAYLDELLKALPGDPSRQDPEFDELMRSLADHGQQEPGLITMHGVLVNGNTRCAALRALGEQYIRVAVLPESANWDDISNVELALQLRKEYKRDYSYINRLMTIDELARSNKSNKDIAKDFHIKEATVERERWIFSVITNAIKRSQADGVPGLSYVFFEDHQEKLRELHRAFNKQQEQNGPEAAKKLKELRLAHIVMSFAKTDVRSVQPDFDTKYLDKNLRNVSLRVDEDDSPETIPGLGVEVPSESRAVKRAEALTDALLTAQAKKLYRNADPAEKAQAEQFLDSVEKGMRNAIDSAKQAERIAKRNLAPSERLSDATEDMNGVIQQLVDARTGHSLDDEATETFDEALGDFRKTFETLTHQIAKTFDPQSENMQWMSKAIGD